MNKTYKQQAFEIMDLKNNLTYNINNPYGDHKIISIDVGTAFDITQTDS